MIGPGDYNVRTNLPNAYKPIYPIFFRSERTPRHHRRWFRSAGERTGPQRRRGDSR